MSAQRTKVLVGVDGSAHSDHAIDWAADEAARFGKTLNLVHVVETATLDLPGRTTDGISEALVQAATRTLQDGRARALKRQPELTVETMVVHERNVPAGLRQYAGDAAETVVGYRGRGGFAGLLLGSTALRLAGHYPGPVTVVRDHHHDPDHDQNHDAAGDIVAGIDLAEDPGPVLDHAFAAAAARGVRLRVLHARHPAPPTAAPGVDLQITANTLHEQLTTALAPWRSRHPDVKVVEDLVIGHPVEMLALASAGAGLLVVGSRGRSFPLGSVSHGVIHHARCPIAVVRPYE
ncbi:universal stress protein [Actinomadura bangladeshensis]|uniref:Universal stress protein n=1 Tax=Actinomadura bangladeshensis TaxID=453573 RepID=A0A4R4P3G2_9ACTN|nr:universal stress protein [Actinomadura bangladeshensis]TDC16174.1 universal stress protein [Actinomadura bangladeshensis]